MKSIHTLIPDIYELVSSKGGWDEVAFDRISSALRTSLVRDVRVPSLRLSQLGPRCPCALWHSIHNAGSAEPLPPHAYIKYTYGHIIEALIIELAKAAGHDVSGEQDEIILDGVVGHRDCVIDGAVVDVKSSSSLGFKKFRDRSIAQDDSFGYLDQLDAYVVGSVMADDPLVTVKDRGYLLAVDKTLGHMCLYEHRIRENSIKERIRRYKRIVSLNGPPACECGTSDEEGSGNIKLGTTSSYSAFKRCCFPKLRTFLNSKGQPVDYVKVVKHPSYKGVAFKEITC